MKQFLLLFISSVVLVQFSAAQTDLQEQVKAAKQLYAKNEYVAAESAFLKIIEANGTHYEALKGLADAIHKQERYKEAIAKYGEAIKLNATDAEIYFNRGAALVFINSFKKAIKDFDLSIELGLNTAEVYYFRGFSNYELSKYQESIDDYTKAIELKPNYAEAYYNRGAAKGELEDFTGGAADFQKAAAENPKLTDALLNIALTKIGEKRYQEAIEDLDKVIEQRGGNLAKAFYYRGEALYELKDKTQACNEWLKSANLGYEQAQDNISNLCNRRLKTRRKIDIVF